MGKIVLEDFNDGNGYYKINLAYLNKEQVEEIENLVAKWKPTDEDIKSCIRMCLTDANEQRFKDYGTNLKDCLTLLEKQKEPPFVKDVVLGYPGHYFYDGERMHFCGNPAMEEKQKEPHYTKRNALFDKCVENCDPKTVEEVNKRVDDIMNMPELSPFEHALTNFIGDWEDDEEHWPSQFVKKHGKHILDMAREELQKEQTEIPLMNGDADLYFDNWNQQKQNPTKRYCFEEGMRYAQRLQKEQKSNIVEKLREISTPADEDWFEIQKQWEKEDEQNPAESRKRDKPKESWLSKAKYEIEHADELLTQRQKELREIRELKNQEQKPVPINPDDKHMLERIMELVEFCNDKETIWNWLCEKVKEQKPADDKAFEEWIDDWWKHNKVNNPDSYDKGDEIQFDELGFKNFCRGIRNMYVNQEPVEKQDIVVQLKKHLANTPKEQLEAEWKELEKWNDVGPTAEEYLRSIKPAEWSEKHIADIFEKVGLAKIVREQGNDKLTNALQDAMLELSKAWNTEWSEEDDWKRKELIQYLKEKGNYRTVWMTWLEHLPERFNLQQKEEWSEEDRKMYKMLSSMIHGTFVVETQETQDKLLSWFKSLLERVNLQSKEEWNKEDEMKREGVIQWLREYQKKFDPKYDSLSIESIDSLIDWLKDLPFNIKKNEDVTKLCSNEWSEEDKQYFDDLIARIEKSRIANRCYIYSDDVDWLKSKLNGNSCK